MSVGTKLLQAAAGNAGEAVYVDDVFSCFLHVGDSTSGRSINNGMDLDGEGGLVWIKGRDAAYNHVLYDTARGATQEMYSNNTDRSAANTNGLTAFNSNGFTIGTAGEVNSNLNEYVSWTFRKQEKFFDIVTWTGDGNSSKTISHNLGSTPGMMILKRTNGLPTAGNWIVFHRGINNDRYLMLNSTADHASYGYDWSPTDTTFTAYLLGGADYSGNTNGDTYIAYLFAHNEQDFGENSDEAIIKCGSYSNSGSAWSVDLGFEPQFLLRKLSDGVSSWQLTDTMRGLLADDGSGTAYARLLKAEVANAENNAAGININSTGFNGTGSGDTGTWVYMAIARPHKPASEFAATDLFTPSATEQSSEPYWTSSHIVDSSWSSYTISGSWYVADRIRQGKELVFNSTGVEGAGSIYQFDYQNGMGAGSYGSNSFIYLLRRAKGFFDVVTYAGTGSNRTQTHNLGVAPELIIIKRRGPSGADWVWYVGPLGAGNFMYGDAGAKLSSTTIWSNTAPTASVFSLGSQTGGSYYRVNGSGSTYIAYLFATVAGISKIGSYTGTGSDLNVDCGFSAGARFILIKRTDGTENTSVGDWYVYDSVRGIVAGNDPYKLLNSSAAQVTNTDYIDPLSSGFTVTSSAPAELNASGGNYIFLAIA